MPSLTNNVLFLTAAVALAVAGAATDIRSRRIPNRLTLPGLGLGLLLHLVLGGWKDFGLASLAVVICGGIFVLFWLAGGMGAGDVKLMAAVGAIAGIPQVAHLLIFTALAGGGMALVLAMARGRLRQTLTNMGALAVHHRFEGLTPHPELNVGRKDTLRLPYGVAIAAGTVLTLWIAAVQR